MTQTQTQQPMRSVRDEIRAFRFDPKQWLWCLRCGRFFQGHAARPDGLGGVQACAFAGCDGAGYGVDVFDWDEWARGAPAVAARWPRRDELHHGLVAEAWRDGDDDGIDAFDDDDGADCPDDDDDDFEPDYAATFAVPPSRAAADVHVRDALLGVSSDGAAPGEATYFRGLDAARLERLVLDRFARPDARTRRGPSLGEFLAFMQRWPEVRAHGHTVHLAPPARDALVIEGVECDLRRLPPARRDAIREEFLARFAGADECIDEPDWLFTWWD